MNEFKRYLKRFFHGTDFLLLFLCLICSAFGCVLISSATRSMPTGSAPYLNTQIGAICIGIFLFFLFTIIDLEVLASFWKWILLFNLLFNLLLLSPFGKAVGGNRSWLYLPGFPTGLQPAEIVKISFILLLAKQMYHFRNNINGVIPVISFAGHTLLMIGLILVISGDMGVALIYIFILVCMMLAAGIKLRWFAIAAGIMAALSPVIWTRVLTATQRNRILIAFNPAMDPQGDGWHTILSMKTIGGGQIFGQGLYQGKQIQLGSLFARHTDFIFSTCGEELGFIGCISILILLSAIIFRCLYMSARAKNGFYSLVCAGVGGMIIFQTVMNVGMCVGWLPVVGLTLPFFSYGGSSTITMFAAAGLVSSARMRPKVTWLDY